MAKGLGAVLAGGILGGIKGYGAGLEAQGAAEKKNGHAMREFVLKQRGQRDLENLRSQNSLQEVKLRGLLGRTQAIDLENLSNRNELQQIGATGKESRLTVAEKRRGAKTDSLAPLLKQAHEYAKTRSSKYNELGDEAGVDDEKYARVYDDYLRRFGPASLTKRLGPKVREVKTDRIYTRDEISNMGTANLKPGMRARDGNGEILTWDGKEFQPEKGASDPLVKESQANREKRVDEQYESGAPAPDTVAATTTAPAPSPDDGRGPLTPKKAKKRVAKSEARRQEILAMDDDGLINLMAEDLKKGVSLIDTTMDWSDTLRDGAKASRLVRLAWQKTKGR